MGKSVHNLSEIDPENQLATCAHCGSRTSVRFRRSAGTWVCRNQDPRKCHQAPHHNNNWVTTREKLAAKQGNRCAICDKKGKLVLDHDHVTGNIREALCPNCNAGLGLLQDDIRVLWSAIEYLKKHKV